jgi:hypothetical protein
MRRLTLRKDVLTELRTDELAAVVGADAATTPVAGCVSDMLAACRTDSVLRTCVSYTCTR